MSVNLTVNNSVFSYPSPGDEPGCIKGCRYCKTFTSDRWYFKDICRSCRRKQLANTEKKVKERQIKAELKANPQCWDCGKDKSTKWYKDATQCSTCVSKAYKKKNSEKIKKMLDKWRKENKEYIKQYKKENRAKTGLHRFHESKRKALKRNALPKWVNTNDLKLVYKNCPEGYTVDHIIPLNNADVCGLHVPWNLQYLTLSDNSFKHNKFDGTVFNDGWKKCRYL
jgi:hypothetical protein